MAMAAWITAVSLATMMLMTTTGAQTTDKGSANKAYIQKMCEQAEYPDLCKATVTQYVSIVKTQSVHDMADAALQAALAQAETALSWAKAAAKSADLSQRERQQASVCVNNLDSAHGLTQQTLSGLRGSSSSSSSSPLPLKLTKGQVSDWQTWMSAALSDDNTCLDSVSKGDDGPNPGPDLTSKFSEQATSLITNVSHVTANSLVFVNKLAAAS